MKPSGKALSLRLKPMWEPLGLVVPRAMLRLYAQGRVGMVTDMGVSQLFAAPEAVASPAAQDTVDCKS